MRCGDKGDEAGKRPWTWIFRFGYCSVISGKPLTWFKSRRRGLNVITFLETYSRHVWRLGGKSASVSM
jgi:hypothetical protein